MAACCGETDAKPELGNLLMQLCIPVLQITWYPYQEGSWGTQFKKAGLRPKVVHVRHKALLTSLLQTQRSANFKWPAHPTGLAHWEPSPLFICKAGTFSSSAAQVSQLSSPHQRAGKGCTDVPSDCEREPLPLAITARAPAQQWAGRGSRRKDLASLHWTSGFLYLRDWQHKCMQTIPYSSETDLFLRIGGAAAATPHHKQVVVTSCKDSQAQGTVIIFRVHIWFPHPTDGLFQCWWEIPHESKQEECWSAWGN